MTRHVKGYLLLIAIGSHAFPAVGQQLPEAIAAKNETVVSKVHAEGAQIYECKADQAGKLAWAFREPIASLMREGKTVGRHYAGPTWELTDGSAIVAKVVGRAPAPGSDDIAWLKLEVSEHRGKGELAGVTAVQRIETQGGALEGPCETAGEFQTEPYAAEYVFLRKGG
jgi:Protein of unknown function (DUF3455)